VPYKITADHRVQESKVREEKEDHECLLVHAGGGGGGLREGKSIETVDRTPTLCIAKRTRWGKTESRGE